MKEKFILILFTFSVLLFSETGLFIYDRFNFDGISDEFTEDEFILVDSVGNTLESDMDSFWGENNDISQLKITWDLTGIYIAVDACSWDNNVILYIDIYDDYGLEDQTELNTWMRNFKFYNFNPDFFLATWDTNTNPQFWKIREGQTKMADETSSTDYSGYDTGNKGKAMEGYILWSQLYYNDLRNMANYPSIRLATLITAGDDYTSGPDCAPDNLGGMSQDSQKMVIIDNYVEILIDQDQDGIPDISGFEIQDRVSYFKNPPIKAKPLEVNNISFLDGKSFNRDKDDRIRIRFHTNRMTLYYVDIYNIEGKMVGEAILKGTDYENKFYDFEWFGFDRKGYKVPYGIYIARVYSDSGELSCNEAFAVVK